MFGKFRSQAQRGAVVDAQTLNPFVTDLPYVLQQGSYASVAAAPKATGQVDQALARLRPTVKISNVQNRYNECIEEAHNWA
jgi:hypothetical protein